MITGTPITTSAYMGNPGLVVVHNGVDPQQFDQADGTRIAQNVDLKDTLTVTFVG